MTLKIEVGKTYLTREGKVVEIVKKTDGLYYPFYSDNDETWTELGECFENSESRFDLVAEAPQPPRPFDAIIAELDALRASEVAAMAKVLQSLDDARAAVDAIIQAAKAGKL